MQIGDVVYLKSGSPPLTVHAMDAEGVDVKWFAGAQQFTAKFPEAALVTVDPTPALDNARRKASDTLEGTL